MDTQSIADLWGSHVGSILRGTAQIAVDPYNS